ncbi:MAG: peptide-methionine (R)-S-oxide reductase, partial [Betaproteobacteria bacterium]|nr:peptide-methionine (R)-S-oxide reductase [Betaproteobacteria bacterium]
MKEIEELQKNWKTLLADKADIATSADPLKRANAEWKKLLSPAAYDVLREEGTERAGTSPLNNEKRPGVFVCAGCSLPLFTSAMKYESGTGWPSFFTTIPGAFGNK